MKDDAFDTLEPGAEGEGLGTRDAAHELPRSGDGLTVDEIPAAAGDTAIFADHFAHGRRGSQCRGFDSAWQGAGSVRSRFLPCRLSRHVAPFLTGQAGGSTRDPPEAPSVYILRPREVYVRIREERMKAEGGQVR